MIEWALVGVLGAMGLVAAVVALSPLRLSIRQRLGYVLLVLTLMACAYLQWGGWQGLRTYDQHQAKLAHANTLIKSMGGRQALIEEMQARLKKNPESSQGWYLLGRLYMTQGSFKQAREAFAQAHALSPDDVTVTVNYAESVWSSNGQAFDEPTRGMLEAVLTQNPNQTDTLAMLVMDAYQQHQYQKAIDYGSRLLLFLPQQSDEAGAIRKVLVKARRHLEVLNKRP